jgi:hypothetical protein
MHSGPRGVDVNPGHDLRLEPGDEILVIAPMADLLRLTRDRRPVTAPVPDGVTRLRP